MRKVLPQIQVGVIASGGDPKSSQSSHSDSHDQNTAVLSPAEHGPDVELEHLGYWPRIGDAGMKNIFNGVPDPGSIGYFIKNTGENGGILLGIANAIQGGGLGQGVTGGQSLTARVEELKQRDIGVSSPPNITDGTERGAKVRKIQESGTMHSLSLLDGLPSHGALFNMAGFKIPELPNVPTARQTNDQMMTQDMMQQLQGAVMSLGSMLQGLMKNGSGGQHGANSGGGLGNGQSYWQDVHDELSPAMSKALTNLETLIQAHETDNGIGYVTGGTVHYGTYLENAVDLLKQVNNLDELMSVMSRLQFDTTLFGQDKLDNVVVEIENAWGTALQEVSSNGLITVTYNEANTQSQFAQSMTSDQYGSAATSAPPSNSQSNSGSGGQGAQQIQSIMGNLFGQSSGVMQDMWKRLAPSGEKTATQMHQKLTQEQEAQQQKQINKATTDGGDPLSKNFYVTTGQ